MGAWYKVGRRLVNRANDLPFGQVTFSAGVADVFVCGDPRSALKAADTALYRAKQEGRNAVRAEPDIAAYKPQESPEMRTVA